MLLCRFCRPFFVFSSFFYWHCIAYPSSIYLFLITLVASLNISLYIVTFPKGPCISIQIMKVKFENSFTFSISKAYIKRTSLCRSRREHTSIWPSIRYARYLTFIRAPRFLNHFLFQSFDSDRIPWRLLQKCVENTKLDIYVLVQYVHYYEIHFSYFSFRRFGFEKTWGHRRFSVGFMLLDL